MSSAINVLNNTILMPAFDSLVSSNPRPASTVAEDLNNAGDFGWAKNYKGDTSNQETIFVKVGDQAAQKLIEVQDVKNLEMKRENEQQHSGGSADYVVNLPGRITYSDITITHLFTQDTFFLDWLTSGAYSGGSARADIEIHFKSGNGTELIFTLCDAFPVNWKLSKQLNSNIPSGSQAELLMEEITITFSKVDFSYLKPKTEGS